MYQKMKSCKHIFQRQGKSIYRMICAVSCSLGYSSWREINACIIAVIIIVKYPGVWGNKLSLKMSKGCLSLGRTTTILGQHVNSSYIQGGWSWMEMFCSCDLLFLGTARFCAWTSWTGNIAVIVTEMPNAFGTEGFDQVGLQLEVESLDLCRQAIGGTR